jgi:hypothetical protein
VTTQARQQEVAQRLAGRQTFFVVGDTMEIPWVEVIKRGVELARVAAVCPQCLGLNTEYDDDEYTEGPREYHRSCWYKREDNLPFVSGK